MPLGITVRPRDLNINIQKKHLTCGLRGKAPIIDDDFQHEVKLDESTWVLEDGKVIFFTIEKVKNIFFFFI